MNFNKSDATIEQLLDAAAEKISKPQPKAMADLVGRLVDLTSWIVKLQDAGEKEGTPEWAPDDYMDLLSCATDLVIIAENLLDVTRHPENESNPYNSGAYLGREWMEENRPEVRHSNPAK